MTDFDLKLCDVQGRLFVLSVVNSYGSEKFVKAFMDSCSIEVDILKAYIDFRGSYMKAYLQKPFFLM